MARRRDEGFFDPWESAPESARRRQRARRLAEYVRHARGLAFYRERLAGFDPRSEQPLAGVAPLRSQDLRRLLPPAGKGLLFPGSPGYTVFQSGGTTGSPKTSLFSHAEMEALELPNRRGFHAVGLRPGDRVANLFAVGQLYMTFLHIHRALEASDCLNFPFSNNTPPEFVHSVSRLFGVNVMTGIASAALRCLRSWAKLGLKGARIERLYYGGEHLYEADRDELRGRFGIRKVFAPGYGTVDTWYIGYQCSACGPGVFHAHDDQCYMEVVDEEAKSPCGPGREGMLYATALPRRLTPIVRYRVGDRARWLGDPCPCGRTTPLFELLGRGDDVLRIGYDSIDYAYLQDCVRRVRGLSGAAQMQKEREKGRDRLILRVESALPASSRRRLGRLLEREVVARRPSLEKLLSQGSVHPLRVEVGPEGSIKLNARTGKLVRVIDDR